MLFRRVTLMVCNFRFWCFPNLGTALLLIGAMPVEAATETDVPIERSDFHLAPLKLDLIWVNPGSFLMGSSVTEVDRDEAEGPRMEVTLSHGFWLGKTEITQAQYAAITGENPSAFKEAGLDAPVEHVSWIMAMAYCDSLTDRERTAGRLPEGFEYTLPTEAEWEYVYRAGTTGEYVGSPDMMGWIESNSAGTTHPVAQKQPSLWGFYDLTGNVLEWCYDWYGRYPGGEVSDPTGPRRGHYRIARGGCWRMNGEVARAAARAGGSAARVDYTLGFRVALHRVR
ncbi:MAG: formylglycine-generating enzyme family protein [Opitutaceae bacterium]|jgi:formylglycine-generating enzyme required for sulfatase activity|nr:formylglycine-generating enzyme family protein [Opitutaceae bacterium]